MEDLVDQVIAAAIIIRLVHVSWYSSCLLRRRPFLGLQMRPLPVRRWHLHKIVDADIDRSPRVCAVLKLSLQVQLKFAILHLQLGLVETELLEELQLQLRSQVLRQKKFSLLLEKLSLRDLIQFLHLVQLLQLHQRFELAGALLGLLC